MWTAFNSLTTGKLRGHLVVIMALLLAAGPLAVQAQRSFKTWRVGNDLKDRPCPAMKTVRDATDYLSKDPKAMWKKQDNYLAHVAPAIRAMNTVSGKGVGGSVAGNLNWTLQRHPNNHLALNALINYSFIIGKYPRHTPLVAPPECYLKLAVRFSPKDLGPVVLMGNYLFRLGLYKESADWYRQAVKLRPNYSEAHYNLGLTLVKLEKYEEAARHARTAYKLKYPLPALRNQLRRRGIGLDGKPIAKKEPDKKDGEKIKPSEAAGDEKPAVEPAANPPAK